MKFKILTFNTWLVPFLSQYPEERGRKIAAFIKKGKFDFVFLQEVSSLKLRELLVNLLPDYFSASFPPQPVGDGLLTFSRYPLIFKKQIRFKNCFYLKYPLSFIDQAAGKGFLLALAKTKKREILLLNTHLNTVYDLGQGLKNKVIDTIHLKQLKEIEKTLISLSLEKKATILGGDLNFLPQSRPYRYLDQSFQAPRAKGKRFFTKDEKNSWWPWVVPFGSPHSGYQIDYLFFDRNHPWRIASLELALKNKYSIQRRKMHLSDHYGLEATTSLP